MEFSRGYISSGFFILGIDKLYKFCYTKADFSEERIVNFYGEYNGYYVVTLENFYGYGTAVMPVVVNGLGFWLGGPYLEVFKFDS